MPVKELKKKTSPAIIKIEKKVEEFISKGGRLADELGESPEDHRLTLRIPKWLMDKVDAKRRERIGTISRNLWILETIDKATRK